MFTFTEVHIRGLGSSAKVDLISVNTAIKIKMVKYECSMEHGDLSSDSFHPLQFGSEIHEHFNSIWQHYVCEQISSLVGEQILIFCYLA